jgi:predicted DNA-binding protein (MmcQ/YjbR family)
MKRDQLLKLIRESRELVKTATPQQKIRLLQLIRESYQRLKESEQPKILVENESETQDYLEEK